MRQKMLKLDVAAEIMAWEQAECMTGHFGKTSVRSKGQNTR